MTPQPGDFAVVSMGGPGGALISAMERVAYRHATHWDHAFIYIGGGKIVQAEPAGAQISPLGGYEYTIWSTGLIPLTQDQRTAVCVAAIGYADAHVGYSYLDYAAIAAHRFHVPAPGLREFIADTGHQICSQLTDRCYQDAGIQLFDDGRWPGYVSPFDLGTLLQRRAAKIDV